MNEQRNNDGVLRLLRMLAERLDSFLEGDETALETLGESIEQGDFSPDEVQSAALVLRSLSSAVAPIGESDTVATAPGKDAHRVLSAEEREILTPEASGYLLGLRHDGSLDADQFERVLDLLVGAGVRPVGMDLACDAATRVALQFDAADASGEMRHGDFDLAH